MQSSALSRVKSSLKKGKRPFGVYAIVVLLVLIVASNALDLVRVWQGMPSEIFPEMGTVIVIGLNIAIAVFCATLALGLWRMQEKAWYATMIASGTYLFFTIWSYYAGGKPFPTMFFLVIIVFYLNQRQVRKAFEKGLATETTS